MEHDVSNPVKRQLSADLFLSSTEKEKSGESLNPQPPVTQKWSAQLGEYDFVAAPEVVNVSPPQRETPPPPPSGEIRNLRSEVEKIQVQMKELAKAYDFKLERLSKSLRRMEELQLHQRQELARQYAELCGKMNERKVSENKVSDLIDRHNSIVASFDTRLAQLKKQLNEREMQFLQAKTALEEAQREILRQKRSHTL